MRRILALLALVLSGCVATPPILIGDPVPPVTAPPAQIALRVLDYRGEPLAGASVTVETPDGSSTATTDGRGLLYVEWSQEGIGVSASAPAHEPGRIAVTELPANEEVELRLTAKVLSGVVTGMGGLPLEGATISVADESMMTGPDGSFQFVAVEEGVPVAVARAAYVAVEAPWEGGLMEVPLEPFVVRGLHVGGPDPRNEEKWSGLLTLAEETEVNTLVVDIKDESGQVYYATEVPLAEEVRAVYSVYDAARVVADVTSRGLYLIGRIVTFQDPIAAKALPELAVLDLTTGLPYNKNGQYFLDPTDPAARQYALDLSVEACTLGFQEIQFDYVRYPDGYGEATRFDGGSSAEVRPEAIRSFLEAARGLLNPIGCAVSADIFGFITATEGDGGIGQQLELLAGVTDVLSPMVYPSHYSTGWYGFRVPNDNPGPVVAGAIDDGLRRVAGDVIIRPWLQDFYYTADQVRAQIEESDARSVGWMLWNAATNFTVGALAPEGGWPEEAVGDQPGSTTTPQP